MPPTIRSQAANRGGQAKENENGPVGETARELRGHAKQDAKPFPTARTGRQAVCSAMQAMDTPHLK